MNIRAVYGTPCRSQYFCKRGNVSGTVDVRVRHVTTMGTTEAVFMPLPQFVAYGARLARVLLSCSCCDGFTNFYKFSIGEIAFHVVDSPVCQNDVVSCVAFRRVLSVNTHTCPAAFICQRRTRIPAQLFLFFENIQEVINGYIERNTLLATFCPSRAKQRCEFPLKAPLIAASALLNYALLACAGKTNVVRPIFVSLRIKFGDWKYVTACRTFLFSNDLVKSGFMAYLATNRTVLRNVFFVGVRSCHAATSSLNKYASYHITNKQKMLVPRNRSWVRNIQDKVKVPLAFFADQFRFSSSALRKKIELMWARSKQHFFAPRHGEQGKRVSLDAIGPLIEVNRLRLEHDQRNSFVFADDFIGFKRFVGGSHLMYGIAGHLTAKGFPLRTNHVVREMVKRNAVPTTMFLSIRYNIIASGRKRLGQVFERLSLFFCVKKLDGYSAFHIGLV